MYTGVLHTHTFVVSLFLLLYLFKTGLLFFGKTETLIKFSKQFKIPEMVISVLFLLTGLYLAINTGSAGSWLWVKLAAIFIAIPLAITGFKKLNKGFALLSLMLLIYAYGISETKSPFFKKETHLSPNYSVGDAVTTGKIIYENECERCHGTDGKLGLSGSKDLTESKTSRDEHISIISNGKNLMPSYRNILTPEQINDVADFVETLKK